jgi:predicted small metal-binding protein
MKDFHCRDAGLNCDWRARGRNDKEILNQAGRHAREAHGMSVDKDLEDRVRTLIHDEDSDEHRRSMGEMIP